MGWDQETPRWLFTTTEVVSFPAIMKTHPMAIVARALPVIVAVALIPGDDWRQESRPASSGPCPVEITSMPNRIERLAGATDAGAPDSDGDGLSDGDERFLLDAYRPFLRFSRDYVDGDLTDEPYSPTDALWFIQQSELLASRDEDGLPHITHADLAANPSSLLFDASSVVSSPGLSRYHLNPVENVPGDRRSHPARHGADWAEVLTRRNVGLYGHVVPYRETSARLDPSRLYYKVEYWQFFGYSHANAALDFGDHEGDWASVQVIYDPLAQRAVSVLHYAHGIEFRFDIAAATGCHAAESDVLELRGRYDPALNLVNRLWLPREDQIARAQNNVVRMYRDPTTAAFTHPVVYVEHGSHEFFPTEFWNYYAAPKHAGDSRFRYLAESPPNLGEVEQPMTEAPGAAFIVRFNGSWGSFGRQNNPPQGPPLHENWSWPVSSSVRWRIPGPLGF